ncbi:MAG: hypothetical protein IPK19_10580 [Chloroflexi bacterium]|nr:hypothetical protein [Chloroflexota bacterium]
MKFVEDRGFLQYCVLIDLLAIATAINPSIIQTIETTATLKPSASLLEDKRSPMSATISAGRTYP